MQSIIKTFFCFLLLMSWSCEKDIYSTEVGNVAGNLQVNAKHPLADSLKAITSRHISRGIPGVQVIVKSPEGWYVVNSGYAKIEDKQPMQDRMVAWLYSISKMYTATLTMLMKERGLIQLDSSIQKYLPVEIWKHLDQSQKITVRMLLNHSSGFKNFTVAPAYFLHQFNQPFHQPTLSEQLEFVYGSKNLFEPGTDFFYSNTNYLLLQFILEKVTGKSWGDLIHAEILQPLGLKDTYYPVSETQVQTLGFPNYYFERFNNGVLENCTKWNNSIAHSLAGYGGIAANGADVIRFMEALLNGKIVNQRSLNEMRSWFQGKQSTEPDYGLGLEYYEFVKGVPTYGHEGDNIGGTTQILYIPSKQIFVFISINAGRQLFGQYLFRTTDLKIALNKYLSGRN